MRFSGSILPSSDSLRAELRPCDRDPSAPPLRRRGLRSRGGGRRRRMALPPRRRRVRGRPSQSSREAQALPRPARSPGRNRLQRGEFLFRYPRSRPSVRRCAPLGGAEVPLALLRVPRFERFDPDFTSSTAAGLAFWLMATRAHAVSRRLTALSGNCRAGCSGSTVTAATIASSVTRTLWCFSIGARRPRNMIGGRRSTGSSTMIGWKRRVSAGSFSIYCRYSDQVVAAMVRNVPRASAGFRRLAASPVPGARRRRSACAPRR